MMKILAALDLEAGTTIVLAKALQLASAVGAKLVLLFRPHSSLGNRTPAEMGAGSVGKPGWGLAPNPVVAITPKQGHQTGRRLYS